MQMRIPDINDWHWHDGYDNEVEEVLVGVSADASMAEVSGGCF